MPTLTEWKQQQAQRDIEAGFLPEDTPPQQQVDALTQPTGAAHQLDEDYEVSFIDGSGYHWEGLASGFGYEEIGCDEGFPTAEAAQADALYWLSRVDGVNDNHNGAMVDLMSLEHFSFTAIHIVFETNKNAPPIETEW